MLRTEQDKQMSLHCMLYDKIPEDHLLKQVSRAERQGTVLCLDAPVKEWYT